MLCLLLDELENIKPVWKSPRGDWGNLCIHIQCIALLLFDSQILSFPHSSHYPTYIAWFINPYICNCLSHAGRTEHKLWIKTPLSVLPVPECSIWLMKNTQLLWQMFKFITSDIKLTLNYPATYSISLMTLLSETGLCPQHFTETKLVVNLDSKQR